VRRNTIVLAVLLAALAGYWWFYERGKNPAAQGQALCLQGRGRDGVALDYQGRAIVLQKDAQTNKWKLAAPLQAPADDAAVADCSRRSRPPRSSARSTKSLEEDLKNFGLAPPERQSLGDAEERAHAARI
jgi:hypothetical protein